eukprot:scaffold5095_cov107-Skeletonema_dohrnii-CCMP3373.AAC.3
MDWRWVSTEMLKLCRLPCPPLPRQSRDSNPSSGAAAKHECRLPGSRLRPGGAPPAAPASPHNLSYLFLPLPLEFIPRFIFTSTRYP